MSQSFQPKPELSAEFWQLIAEGQGATEQFRRILNTQSASQLVELYRNYHRAMVEL